jgi:hypothetical protein
MIDIQALNAAAWSLTLICAIAIVVAAATIGRAWLTERRRHPVRPHPAARTSGTGWNQTLALSGRAHARAGQRGC